MNDKETIVELAHTTLDRMSPDDYCREPYWTATDSELEKFAKLVAEHERELCAKVCDEWVFPVEIQGAHPDYLEGKRMAMSQCAAAIRARGEHGE